MRQSRFVLPKPWMMLETPSWKSAEASAPTKADRLSRAVVCIVDDDAGVRYALSLLIEGDGLRVNTYATAEAFLLEAQELRAGCVIVDVRLPEMTGPELQHALLERDIRLPIIFLSAHADVAT